MRTPENMSFFLEGDMQEKSLGKKLGKLSLDSHRAAQAPYQLLDCFNQTIRKSGQLLVFSGKQLTLIRPDGSFLSQPAEKGDEFVAELHEGAVKKALSFVSPLRRLLVAGQGMLSGTLINALDVEGKTHARLHLKTFQADQTDKKITLATLQALRGYESAFAAMKRKLGQLGFTEAHEFSNIYARLIPDYRIYDPKPAIEISKDEQAFQAANDIIRAYIEVARLNEPGIIADLDTEFLHDYRVSLRKIRSVISLFKGIYSDEQTATLKGTFSDLMSPTGRLRDLDVYLLDRESYFRLLPDSLHDGLSMMFGVLENERNEELRMFTAHLQDPAYDAAMNKLHTLFTNPDRLEAGANADHSAYLYARELIWKRYRKVCKTARAITPDTPDTEIHQLRIHCKKLRYLMEFFSPMFPPRETRRLLKALKALQDNLGLFNDYSVQQDFLQDFISTHGMKGREQDISTAKSIGALIAILHQKQLDERGKVISNFETFDSPAIQQKFQKLFKL